MARTSAVAALRDRLAEVTAERDRLRDAIDAISRHREARADWPATAVSATPVAVPDRASTPRRHPTDR